MARPSKFDRGTTVERAMNEIWRGGYEANSVKAMSEKLGITRSSYYNAFGSREALFAEALALYFTHSPDRALAEAGPGVSIKRLLTDTFRTVCKARAADPENRGCMVVNSIAELCATHEALGSMLEQAVLGSLARIETLLQRAEARREIAAEADTHALALAVQNLLMGLNVLCKVVHEEDELWRVAETTLRGLNLLAED